jgi:fructokinase
MTEPASATTTLQGMTRARETGALVSFDMNLRPALWPRDGDPAPTIWRALALAAFVKLSAEELAFLAVSAGSEAAVLERLWSGGTQFVVITDGERALRWFTRNATGGMSPFAVRVVDSTGAGDAFVGGFLHALVAAGSLPALLEDGTRRDAALRFAAACGALAVTRTGSFAAMPALADVHAFLEQHA